MISKMWKFKYDIIAIFSECEGGKYKCQSQDE